MTAFDFVVVGAGSAGAPLAARLSEDASVLLLEAGPDYRSAAAPEAMRSPNPARILAEPYRQAYQWPELKARRTSRQQPARYWRGRGMGGTSAINGQVAIRGLPEDFDRWAESGCAGWSARDVLPAFIRLEDDVDYGDRPYHGRLGPVPIMRNPQASWGAIDRALRDACLDLGYGWADDHNAPVGTGVSPFALNGRDGVRVSTNDAYLEPARGRANLTIVGDALVDRVEFAGSRAVGVRYRGPGGWTSARAGEVVLCAGVIHSPAILMRSGVGPEGVLRASGVRTLVGLPGVGANLLEHPLASTMLFLRPACRARSVDERYTNCCVRFSSRFPGSGHNDMMFLGVNLFGAEEDGLSIGLMGVSVFESFSCGELRITSADPQVDPCIDMRLLSDERDLRRMRAGVRRLFEVCRHPAVAEIAERIVVGMTGQGPERFGDDSQLDDWLFAECLDAQHTAGTCRMGPADRPDSVVDPECRVLGTSGLRVIDASIMPEIPRANTHLTTVMIAEHMAARIRRAAGGSAG